MTLPIIALIVSVFCLIANIVIYKQNKKKRNQLNTGFNASDSYDNLILSSVKKDINILSNKVQPLIDKHNEEQKQEEIKTRKAHWKSFNTWKMQKERMNRDAGDKPICGACYNDSLEFVIEYEIRNEPSYRANRVVNYLFSKNDYPLSAEQKCTVCGHVADKWKYEEC
ncbi:hypothetical protein [Mammaliicoccus sciuri]|uniref:hypothetical protein n=1 Tax=Mammaliicoccus sciuri TaxID=1296 RepID=UPI0034DCD2B7